MIRREMIEQLREESYDLLENSILENSDPEFEPPDPELDRLLTEPGLVRSVPGAWRPPPEPQPPKRQPSTIETVHAARSRDWETFIDARILAQFSRGGELYEMFVDGVGDALGEVRERHRRALAVEVKALRRELDAARAQIEALQGGAKITSWSIDRKNYRATPFGGSTPGSTLDLRPLFERYQQETAD